MTKTELEKVPDPTAAPYRSVVHQSISRRKGLGWISMRTHAVSTGFLIDRSTIWTAAHNVNAEWYNRLAGALFTLGGTSDDPAPAWQVTLGSVTTHVAAGYSWGRFQEDYAVVRLGEASPAASDFQLGEEEAGRIEPGQQVHVAGYASEDPRDGTVLYHAAGTVTDVGDPALIRYAINTEGGMSGGPVWITDKLGKPLIVGIHVGEDATAGFARRIDRTVAETFARVAAVV